MQLQSSHLHYFELLSCFCTLKIKQKKMVIIKPFYPKGAKTFSEKDFKEHTLRPKVERAPHVAASKSLR